MSRPRRATAALPPLPRRPSPPEPLREISLTPEEAIFAPAPDLLRWIRDTFIEGIHTSALQNADHEHLSLAQLGLLWTNGKSTRAGRVILGTAEIPNPKGDAWQRQRQLAQLRDWFGAVPDFVITISAPYAAACDNAAFCALVEHELYHCAQKVGENGPCFSRVTGLPLWTIRGHDVEEFVGVVRRYGADAAGVRDLVDAARSAPLIPAEAIQGACGTCLRLAA